MLRELVLRVIGVLPQFGPALYSVALHPVREVTARAVQARLAWDAVAFWAICQAIGVVLRYFTFALDLDFLRYALARGIGLLVTLVGLAFAFSAASWLVRRPVPVSASLIATALLWGCATVLSAPFVVVIWATTLGMDPALIDSASLFLRGCTGPQAMIDALFAARGAIETGGHGGIRALIVVYGLLVLVMTAIYLAYGAAFFRVLARVGGMGGARLGALIVIGLLLGGVAATFESVAELMLSRGAGACP